MADDSILDGILADSDSPSSFGNPELMAQARRLAMRRAQLEADAISAAKQTGRFAAPAGTMDTGGFTSAVTGTAIPGIQRKRPLLSSLSGLIADTGLGMQQAGYEKDLSGYNRLEAAAAKAHMEAMPRDIPAQPVEQVSPDGTTYTAYTAPQPADRQSKLEWARKAQTIPSLKNIGDAYLADLVVKEPEREEARAERQLTREEARAEAQRKQKEELEYRRQRDKEANDLRRDIAQQNADLRRELQASIAASRASGNAADKAANWKQETAEDGSISYYNVVTGERKGSGGQGKPTAQFAKDQQATRDQQERSQNVIDEAPRMKQLLAQGSSSGLRADIRKAGSYFAPGVFSGKAQEADEALKPLADLPLKAVPRFEGPQSDKDTASYKEAAAQVANTNLPPAVRSAALDEVVRLHKKAIAQRAERSSFSGDSAARKRDNGAAYNSGGGRSLTFNPNTGKLE